MLDSNGDGIIEMKELQENFKDSSGGGLFEQIIKEVDLDNDGQISVKEFNIGMKKMLINCFRH